MGFRRIRRRLDLGAGETASSLVSRLALRSGLPNAAAFCDAHGEKFKHIIMGSREHLASLAEAADVDCGSLVRHSLRRTADGWALNGVPMAKHALQKSSVKLCPMCLKQDMAVAERPSAAAYDRGWWHATSIRTCAEHGIALAPVAVERDFIAAHDSARLFRPHLPRLDDIAAGLKIRSASDLETYLLGRLERRGAESAFLDALDFHVVAKTSEAIGAIEHFGIQKHWRELTSDDWWEAGRIGFPILAAGPAGLASWLKDKRLRSLAWQVWTAVPTTCLGQFYHWLTHAAAPFEPIRGIFAEAIFDSFHLAEGAHVLGHQLPQRRIWSLTAASKELKRGDFHVRRFLIDAGVVPVGCSLPSREVLIPVNDHTRHLFDTIRDSVTLEEAQKILGVTRTEAVSLVDAGLIQSLLKRDGTLRQFTFARSELMRLRESILVKTVPSQLEAAGRHMVDLRTAARFGRFDMATIVTGLLNGRFRAVHSDDVGASIAKLKVDFHEVRDRLSEDVEDGITFRQIMALLETTDRTVTILIQNGFLPPISSQGGLKGKSRLYSKKSVLDFASLYACAFPLAKRIGVNARSLQCALRREGIEPIVVMRKGKKIENSGDECKGLSRLMIYKISDLRTLGGKCISLWSDRIKPSEEDRLHKSIMF